MGADESDRTGGRKRLENQGSGAERGSEADVGIVQYDSY